MSELAIAVQMQKGCNRRAGADFIISGIGQEFMRAIRQLNSELLPVVSLFLVLLKLRHNQALKTQQAVHHRARRAEQDRPHSEVGRRTAQLVELNHHLQTAREDECHRPRGDGAFEAFGGDPQCRYRNEAPRY